jgi:hypothetical protein
MTAVERKLRWDSLLKRKSRHSVKLTLTRNKINESAGIDLRSPSCRLSQSGYPIQDTTETGDLKKTDAERRYLVCEYLWAMKNALAERSVLCEQENYFLKLMVQW